MAPPQYYDERGRGTATGFHYARNRRPPFAKVLLGAVAVLVGIALWRVFTGGAGEATPPASGGQGATTAGTGTNADTAGEGSSEASAGTSGSAGGVDAGTTPPEIRRIVSWGLPIYCAAGNEPLVALTFDDGPGAFTQDTIDTLRSHEARATFFLAGKLVEPNAQLARAEARFGEVANHSWSHYGLAGEPKSVLKDEVARPQKIIEHVTGRPVWYFRPPWGSRDVALDRYVKKLDMILVLWSLDTRDSFAGVNTERIVRNFRKGISAGDIVLLHENRGTTKNALPELLSILKEEGLKAVTLTELLVRDPPSRKQVKSASCS